MEIATVSGSRSRTNKDKAERISSPKECWCRRRRGIAFFLPIRLHDSRLKRDIWIMINVDVDASKRSMHPKSWTWTWIPNSSLILVHMFCVSLLTDSLVFLYYKMSQWLYQIYHLPSLWFYNLRYVYFLNLFLFSSSSFFFASRTMPEFQSIGSLNTSLIAFHVFIPLLAFHLFIIILGQSKNRLSLHTTSTTSELRLSQYQ